MPHPRPLKRAVSLVHTTSGDLVQVKGLEEGPLTAADAPLELREGEVVQCLRNDGDGVLIARGDGSRLLVPPGRARTLEIRWFPELLEQDEESDDSSGGGESDANGTSLRWKGLGGQSRTGSADGELRRGRRTAAPGP